MSELEITKLPAKERIKLEKKFGKTVRVSRKDYEILYCAGILLDDRTDIAGLCDSENHIIFIDAKCNRDIESTLLHELCHAELSESGLRQRNDWDMNLEETLCEIFAESLSNHFKLRAK